MGKTFEEQTLATLADALKLCKELQASNDSLRSRLEENLKYFERLRTILTEEGKPVAEPDQGNVPRIPFPSDAGLPFAGSLYHAAPGANPERVKDFVPDSLEVVQDVRAVPYRDSVAFTVGMHDPLIYLRSPNGNTLVLPLAAVNIEALRVWREKTYGPPAKNGNT